MHIAQVNVSKLRAPMDDPSMRDFVEELDRVNAIADRSPGFVWRLQTDEGNATSIRAYDDPAVIANVSVWQNFADLRSFVYGAAHSSVLRQRDKWLQPDPRPSYALWWIAEHRVPDVEEAKLRLDIVRLFGPTELAFSFAHPFPEM